MPFVVSTPTIESTTQFVPPYCKNRLNNNVSVMSIQDQCPPKERYGGYRRRPCLTWGVEVRLGRSHIQRESDIVKRVEVDKRRVGVGTTEQNILQVLEFNT